MQSEPREAAGCEPNRKINMAKKEPSWKTDPSSFFHPNTHSAFLIVCSVVLAIAVGIFLFCFSLTYSVITAPYHVSVEAKLEKITEGETEKWKYIENKQDDPNPNLRATRTYKESYSVYHWKYYVDDIPHTYTSTTESGIVGNTREMKFWSDDGVEYYRDSTGLGYIFMFVSALFALAALFIIIRIIIIKIIMAKDNSGKKKRREEAMKNAPQTPELINLGNFSGKRVILRDNRGDCFEGVAEYFNKNLCEQKYGRREPAIKIANFLFFRSDVKDVVSVKNAPFTSPFGRIEELNFQSGIQKIEEELFCKEDEHVYRMLLCLEEHIVRKGESCEGLHGVLIKLLNTELTDRSRRKAQELLAQIQSRA